jgi:AcrR family transcriptional regulator
MERQRREDTIVATAEQLLTERGYANLNMDELANVVGISKPTLYQHFKSKDELVVKVLLRSYQLLEEFLSRPLDEPALTRLIALLRQSTAGHAPGSIFASLRSDMRPEALWKMFRDNPILIDRKDWYVQKLYALVDKAKEEGNIDSSIPTPIVTHTLVALRRSLADPGLQAEFTNSPDRLESAVESVVRVFLHGVTPQK